MMRLQWEFPPFSTTSIFTSLLKLVFTRPNHRSTQQFELNGGENENLS